MWLAVRYLGGLGWLRMLAGPVVAAGLGAVAAALLYQHFIAAVVALAVTYVVGLLAFEHRVFPSDAAVLWRMLPWGRRAA